MSDDTLEVIRMGKVSTHDDVITQVKPRLDVALPSMYKVIYINDEQTSFEFVIESLMIVFEYEEDTAVEVAHTVNEHGSAVVAVLAFELAEQKTLEVTTMARGSGFPLKVIVEKDG